MQQKLSVFTKNKINKYHKTITVDSDKSISHRCYIIGSQCLGISKIKGLYSDDIKTTIDALKKLGVRIEKKIKLITFMELESLDTKNLRVH